MWRTCNVVLNRIRSLGLRLHILPRIVGHKRNQIQGQYIIQVAFTGFGEWLGFCELWLSADIKVLAKISLLLIWRWYRLYMCIYICIYVICILLSTQDLAAGHNACIPNGRRWWVGKLLHLLRWKYFSLDSLSSRVIHSGEKIELSLGPRTGGDNIWKWNWKCIAPGYKNHLKKPPKTKDLFWYSEYVG